MSDATVTAIIAATAALGGSAIGAAFSYLVARWQQAGETLRTQEARAEERRLARNTSYSEFFATVNGLYSLGFGDGGLASWAREYANREASVELAATDERVRTSVRQLDAVVQKVLADVGANAGTDAEPDACDQALRLHKLDLDDATSRMMEAMRADALPMDGGRGI